MRAPDAKPVYRRLLVALAVSDLAERQNVEDKFVIDGAGTFVASYHVLFPGRQYSAEELSDALAKSGADGVLIITLNQAGVTTSRAPTTTTAQCTAVSSSGGCIGASAITTGGYDISKPWASFTAQLFDLPTGRVVWFATSKSKGNAFAHAHNLLESMAGSTIAQLRADGVVVSR